MNGARRRVRTSPVARVLLVLVLLAGSSLGQADNHLANPRPDLWCDGPYEPGHALAFETLETEIPFASLTAAGEWREADRRIAAAFQRFVAALAPVDGELREFWSGLQYYLSGSVQNFARWQPIEAGADELVYELPVGPARESAIVRVDCAAIARDSAAAAIAYTAASLYRVGESGHDEAMRVAAAKLDAVYQTHRDRLFNGLPMWPWEMWINGLDIDFETTDPVPADNTQWIFMRPTLSPALKFDGNENSELDAGLVVEPIGFIRYTRDDFSKWIGASPIVTITNGNGIGYGALVRYGDWQLGAAYHDDDGDVLLYVSLDLYDFVVDQDTRTADADEFLEGLVRKLSERDTGATPE
jgi:hypothetical protein